MIHKVVLSKTALKQVLRVPVHIREKLYLWIENVGIDSLEAVRKVPGYHDEPLKGMRQGQRSIRLSKAYRAIYEIKDNGQIEFVEVIEVNKHEY